MLEELFDPALAASIARLATPILLAALGGALCERAGVFNIALEGFILLGAFLAVLGSYFSSSPLLGLMLAMAGGMGMGLLFAAFHLRRGADPIVVSIALNLIGLGLSTYLLRAIFGVSGVFQDDAIGKLPTLHLPLVDRIPFLGDFLSGQSILFYLALIVALAMHFFFLRHRLGLRLRAAGENPVALQSLGVEPARMKLLALLACGVLCGMAGAQLSISNVSLFVENMSAGRGWIAVVAVLLSRGRPLGLFLLVFLFGAIDSLSLRVQGFGWPQQFTEMLPYVATLLALIALSWRRSRTSRLA